MSKCVAPSPKPFATVAHEMMHGSTVINHGGKANIAWQAALNQDNYPRTNLRAMKTVKGIAGKFGTSVASEIALRLITGNTNFIFEAANIYNQIGEIK